LAELHVLSFVQIWEYIFAGSTRAHLSMTQT